MTTILEFAVEDAPEGEAESEAEEKDVFDFSSPENVLIEVIADDGAAAGWSGHSIETCSILDEANSAVCGAAYYAEHYSGYLEQTIKGLIDCPGPGWFVVEGVTGRYFHGDGYEIDDDMDFYFESVRPATAEEIGTQACEPSDPPEI